MKTKLEMAHEYLLRFSGATVADAWAYVDAMQAEVDKRKKAQQIEHVFEAIDEWQPDWSQAPEWANWWAIGSLTKQGIWSEAKPNSVKINGADYWEVTSPIGDEHLSVAPSFNYQGDWRDSLRKRPQ